MPSHSAYLQSNARSGERARAIQPLAAAAMISWLAAVCLGGCRDMREDANYCTSCALGEVPDGTMTGAQDMSSTSSSSDPGTTSNPPSTNGGRSSGSTTTASNQAGNGAQAASPAAPSGGASAQGNAGAPTAGSRGQAGTAARGGNGQPTTARDAGSSDTGSGSMRDAGSQEPDPEPTRDAGNMTPALPCNGTCPNDRPVCDETKPVPQCVQCTAQEQFACVGATSTCDVEQQKCVECTPEDARYCDGATPTCNKDNRCVACSVDIPTSCPPAQSLCDNEQRCVECLPGRIENCPSDRTMCNDEGQCVACMNDAQCLDPALPRCDSDSNSCVGCEGPSDCARFPGALVCDPDIKACVACSPSGALCPAGQLCDRNIYQCVPGDPRKNSCDSCRTDSDCADSPSVAACIEQDNERFCFTATLAAAPLCELGYAATGVNGREHMYCMPIGGVTCPAISKAVNSAECSNANGCGKGGQCRMPDNICTLACSETQPCPGPLTCDTDAKICRR